MAPDRKVYLLDPKQLSPETIAVAFAKTSRSPKSFQEIANELSDENSSDFHEKWVIGYGHASVAEHAVLHIAVENISRLAIECLESNRLASFTEKSTRYQKWDSQSFHTPTELECQPALKAKYESTCRHLFDAYLKSVPAVKAVIEAENPRQSDESTAAWDRRIRTDYVDVCRFLLPASSLANVGITINGRALEHAIRKMLSHPLEEVRKSGEEIKKVAVQNVPTLVKYAEAVPYLQDVAEKVPGYLDRNTSSESMPGQCDLVAFDETSEDRVLAAVLFRYGSLGFREYLQEVSRMSPAEKQRLASLFLGNLSGHDIPLRELEHMSFTFDVVLDQGAYFELKRHRMMTQTPQLLTTRLGYSIPLKIVQAGMLGPYELAMAEAEKTFHALTAYNPAVGSYIVPNAYNRRVLLTMNFRSAYHLIHLRTAPNAHFSIRRIAQQMYEQISQAAPLIGAYLQQEKSESWQTIETSHFQKV